VEHCSLDLDIGEVESMQLLKLLTWTSMAEVFNSKQSIAEATTNIDSCRSVIDIDRASSTFFKSAAQCFELHKIDFELFY